MNFIKVMILDLSFENSRASGRHTGRAEPEKTGRLLEYW
jgi:hypothetical protein